MDAASGSSAMTSWSGHCADAIPAYNDDTTSLNICEVLTVNERKVLSEP